MTKLPKKLKASQVDAIHSAYMNVIKSMYRKILQQIKECLNFLLLRDLLNLGIENAMPNLTLNGTPILVEDPDSPKHRAFTDIINGKVLVDDELEDPEEEKEGGEEDGEPVKESPA